MGEVERKLLFPVSGDLCCGAYLNTSGFSLVNFTLRICIMGAHRPLWSFSRVAANAGMLSVLQR